MRTIASVPLLLLTLLGVARADWRKETPGPLATDRPGNGNTATTMTRGRLNVESSVLFAMPGRGSYGLSAPTLLRLGILDRLEARAGTSIVGWSKTPDGTGNIDATDTSVGMKVGFVEADGGIPDLAASADLWIPTGSDAFTGAILVPEGRLLAAWALPAELGLLVNLGADSPQAADGDRTARLLYVLNLSLGLSAVPALSCFVELFARHSLLGGDNPLILLDWGGALRLSNNLQLDVFFQHGVTGDAPSVQVSAGVSARI